MLRPRFFCANASATPTPTTYVNFVPTLGKTAVDDDVKDILILNTSGTTPAEGTYDLSSRRIQDYPSHFA